MATRADVATGAHAFINAGGGVTVRTTLGRSVTVGHRRRRGSPWHKQVGPGTARLSRPPQVTVSQEAVVVRLYGVYLRAQDASRPFCSWLMLR